MFGFDLLFDENGQFSVCSPAPGQSVIGNLGGSGVRANSRFTQFDLAGRQD
jgi:hypothetical protein